MLQFRQNLIWFLVLAWVAAVPSIFVWFRQPFVVTEHEFDFFLGLLTPEGQQRPPWVAWLGCLVHVGLHLALGWNFYRLISDSHANNGDWTSRERWLVTAGICPFLLWLPWQSPDVFCYIGLGWIQSAHDMNPYRQTIAEAPDFPDHSIYANIFPAWTEVITPYGPLLLGFMAHVAALGGGDERISLLILKFIFLGLHLLSAQLATIIGRGLGMRPKAVFLFFALNPFLLFCFVGRLHNDILMQTCVLAGIALLLRRLDFFAVISFAVAASLKYAPLLMFPSFMAYALRGIWRPGQLFRIFGLSALFTLCFTAAHLLYPDGLNWYSRVSPEGDQFQLNMFYGIVGGLLSALNWVDYEIFKSGAKVLFLLIYSFLGIRLLAKGRSVTAQDLFITLSLMFLCFFTIGTSFFHEWYAGWLLVSMIWVNRLAYFRAAIALPISLQTFAILTGQASPIVFVLGWSLMFLLLWLCLGYLLRSSSDHRPSPLFVSTTDPLG
jgi:hypothetical protein